VRERAKRALAVRARLFIIASRCGV
jgi:hypothetical protein